MNSAGINSSAQAWNLQSLKSLISLSTISKATIKFCQFYLLPPKVKLHHFWVRSSEQPHGSRLYDGPQGLPPSGIHTVTWPSRPPPLIEHSDKMGCHRWEGDKITRAFISFSFSHLLVLKESSCLCAESHPVETQMAQNRTEASNNNSHTRTRGPPSNSPRGTDSGQQPHRWAWMRGPPSRGPEMWRCPGTHLGCSPVRPEPVSLGKLGQDPDPRTMRVFAVSC